MKRRDYSIHATMRFAPPGPFEAQIIAIDERRVRENVPVYLRLVNQMASQTMTDDEAEALAEAANDANVALRNVDRHIAMIRGTATDAEIASLKAECEHLFKE